MWEAVKGVFQAAKDFLFSAEKRKQEHLEAVEFYSSEPPSKRSRLNWNQERENQLDFNCSADYHYKGSRYPKTDIRQVSPEVTIVSTPFMAKEPVVYDISDDEDDDVKAITPGPSRVLKPKQQEVIDLETPIQRSNGFSHWTPVDSSYSSHRHKTSVGTTGRHCRSDSKTNRQRPLVFGSPPSMQSSIWSSRAQHETFQIHRAYEKAKAMLSTTASATFETRPKVSSNYFFKASAATTRTVSQTENNSVEELLPDPSSQAIDSVLSASSKCSVASSDQVSVAETSGSDSPSSSPPLESRHTPLKPSSSAERLNTSWGRSTLSALNDKYSRWDPKRIWAKLTRGADEKARRNEIVEKLNIEAKLRRDARLALQKSVEDEVRLRMRLEGLLIEEKEPCKDELIVLTDDQLDIVESAIGLGPSGEVLADGFNIPITRHDLLTLTALNWLNDAVINFFFQMIMDRGGKNGMPKVYVTNTFFYTKILQGGQSSVKRWTKKIDIFYYDLMLVPVHLGAHWCLAAVDFRSEIIQYYDSLGGTNRRGLQALLKYLQDEHFEKKQSPLDVSNWELIHVDDIPQQTNGSDCGVFTCRFAECVSRDAPITFTQERMPYFRIRMIYEILTKRLL